MEPFKCENPNQVVFHVDLNETKHLIDRPIKECCLATNRRSGQLDNWQYEISFGFLTSQKVVSPEVHVVKERKDLRS